MSIWIGDSGFELTEGRSATSQKRVIRSLISSVNSNPSHYLHIGNFQKYKSSPYQNYSSPTKKNQNIRNSFII